MLRQLITVCVVASLLGGPAIINVASADTIGDCCLTGYTFMGGQGPYTSTPSGPNVKDYFLSQSLNYDYEGTNMWGYGWVKFENLASSPVNSAYLVYDLLGIGAMSIAPATPEDPAILDIYSPGDIDVADLGHVAGLITTLRNNLDGTTPLHDDIIMTSNGTYRVDITDIYNGWVTGTVANNGLVFTAPDDGLGAQFASFGNADGDAPYISPIDLRPIPGDANGDRVVDENDAADMAENWGKTTLQLGYDTFWEMGDFNGDQVVGPADASIMAANWGDYTEGEGNAVPEPSATMLLLAVFGWLICTTARAHRARNDVTK